LIGLSLVPLTIHSINPVQFGIWLTISSMGAWISNFDIGLSHGLRNKLAHALALGETDNIKGYVSTTYAILFLVSLFVFFVFSFTGSFFDWNQILNINSSINYNIWPVIVVTLAGFCVQFALQPINTVLIATHNPFKASLITFLGQLLTFVIIFVWTRYIPITLLMLVTIMVAGPILVMVLAHFYFFIGDLRKFSPRFGAIQFTSAKSLLHTGGVFFILQLGALILYQTDNIIITKTLGPKEVTVFNIAYKIFTVLMTVFSIILAPYWSAFTDAYAKNDMDWIKNSISKMQKIWLLICGASILVYLLSGPIYKLWIGNAVHVPGLLSFSMAIFVMVLTRYGIYTSALNGMGKLKIQLFFLVLSAIVNIPLSIFLIHKIGISGTIIANTIVFGLMNVIFNYQVNLIINGKAKGIWNI
jgi:O-antigen/teichoic acid export membrane protein